VVRSTQKGLFTSTDGKFRKFTHGAEVDLQFLVEKHGDGIENGEKFVDREGDAVLGCVFAHSLRLPTEELLAGFAEGRMYERGLITWIRGQSCKDLNRNKGGTGKIPLAVRTCGGSAWCVVHRPAARRKRAYRGASLGASRGAKQGGSGAGRRAAPGQVFKRKIGLAPRK
jgi:hypothetical protein